MSSPESPVFSTQVSVEGVNADNVSSSDTSTYTNGRVKWFNNKAGYGFITISSGEHSGEDVFVHHSAIQVSLEQYRYLVQGEYVEFKLCEVSDESHKWQAGAVRGINTGKLMCETRLETRENRTNRQSDGEESYRTRPPRDNSNMQRVRTRGPGPREGEEWMLVRRKVSNRYQNNQSPQHEVVKSRSARPPFKDGEN